MTGRAGTWRGGLRGLPPTWAPSTFPPWRPWWSVDTGESELTMTNNGDQTSVQLPDGHQVPLLLHAPRAAAGVSHLPQAPAGVDTGDPL